MLIVYYGLKMLQGMVWTQMKTFVHLLISMSCAIPPEDGKLKELVLLLQQHKYSIYCERNKQCRFNFPHPPSPKTVIAEPCPNAEAYDKAY